MIMTKTIGDHDWRSFTELLVALAEYDHPDESGYGVHRFGRRVVIEHDLGDTQEPWPTIEEAKRAFDLAYNDACYWQTGHRADCSCPACEPRGLRLA